MISSPALLHAAWITAAVAVCLILCTIHSRKNSSSSARRGSSRSATSVRGSSRPCREGNAGGGGGGVGGGGGATAAVATLAAKVSPTPSDTAKADFIGELQAATAAAVADPGGVDDAAGPVTIIDVGTHGPIAPVFPVPDPQPPRRSLSVKHIRFAERLGRIRSKRWGGDDGEEAASGGPDDSTLWTKTILLGERCRVPSGDANDGDDDNAMVRWKSYRPRQPRSTPVTRSNSFAGVDKRAGSCRPAAAARL